MKIGIEITADSGPGILHRADRRDRAHHGDILSVEI